MMEQSSSTELDAQVLLTDVPFGETFAEPDRNNNTDPDGEGEDLPNHPSTTIDCYSYACQLLSKMQDKINDLKEFLSEIPFPTDYSDSMLGQIQRCSSSNEIQNFQQPLGIFVELVKLGFMDKESRDRTSRKSSVAGENIEKGIDAPSDQMDESIPDVIQVKPINEQEFSSPSLSDLLSPDKEILDQLHDVILTITDQPKAHWHYRTIRCLENKTCSALAGQSGKQRQYILIKWSNIRKKYNLKDLFLRVQLLGADDKPHPTKMIVPPKTKVRRENVFKKKTKRLVNNDTQSHTTAATTITTRKSKKGRSSRKTIDDLIIDKAYGFNKEFKMILYPLVVKKRCPRQMNLEVRVFNIYKSDEEENDEDQLSKLFKLRLQLFQKTSNGMMKSISDPIDTILIEESKSTEELQIKECNLISGENKTVQIVYNTDSEKEGFVVRVNERVLESSEYSGIKDKTMVIKAPEFNENFDLKIVKTTPKDQIIHGCNPPESLLKPDLLSVTYSSISGFSQE